MKEKNTAIEARRPTALDMKVNDGEMAPASFGEMLKFAEMVSTSGMVPKQYQGNTGACLVAFQMGAEIGLKPLAALQNIAVINGRPSLWGDGMLAVVRSHPECEDVIELDPGQITDKGECTVKRKGCAPIHRTFSIEDAKTAGLWKKQGPWTQYPRRMLQMRARGFACRDAFPDALRGIYSAEEMRDAGPSGDFVMPVETVCEKPAELPEGRGKIGEPVAETQARVESGVSIRMDKIRVAKTVAELVEIVGNERGEELLAAATKRKHEILAMEKARETSKQEADAKHDYGPPPMTEEELAEDAEIPY